MASPEKRNVTLPLLSVLLTENPVVMKRVGAGLAHRSQQAGVTVGSHDPRDVRLQLLVHLDPGRLPAGERPPGGEVSETEVVSGGSLGRSDGRKVEVEGGGDGDPGVEVREGHGGPQVEADRGDGVGQALVEDPPLSCSSSPSQADVV